MTAVCLLVLCVPSGLSQAADDSIAGEWAGGYDLNGIYTPIGVHFKRQTDSIKGTLDLPMREEIGVVLKLVSSDSSDLHFELPRRSGPIIFDGKLGGDTVSGTILQGNARGMFHLVRIARIDPELYDRYVGDYRLDGLGFIGIQHSRWPVDGISFSLFTANGTTRFGQLFATGTATFLAGDRIEMD